MEEEKRKKLKLTGKQLRAIGYPEGPVISIAMNLMQKYYKHESVDNALILLEKILKSPEEHKDDPELGFIAKQFLPPSENDKEGTPIELKESGIIFKIYGEEHIDDVAISQMQNASRLPIAVAGALMPDAHPGYGLPIGGVLATENAIIPYGVGVDIGCRMCLSIFDINPKELGERIPFYSRELNEATLFGTGRQFETFRDHEILSRKEFDEIEMLRSLKDRAAYQLGSSGSGNHFVEFGEVEITEKDPILNVAPGKYVGLLSHSGSRGLVATIANHYTKRAKEKIKLQGEAGNLAWLHLNEEEGIEYWLAMNLAGDYASANHHIIHAKIAKQLGRQPIRLVENHHNFAWKEIHQGRELIVHRKGATPAGKNVLGIIPGSMTAPGFIVLGRGDESSLNSASHGAGRQLSRSVALKSITQEKLNAKLEKHGVTLIGGGLDEAPFAYKDINEVMRSQENLIDIVGKFIPKIVKMDNSSPVRSRKRK